MKQVVDALTARAVAQWAPDGRSWSGPTSSGATPPGRRRPRRRSAVASGRARPCARPPTTGSRSTVPSAAAHRPPRRGRRGRGPRPSPTRKPEWLRARVSLGARPMELKRTVRDLDLVTVCEEAGCPNISECWSDGTATFMINGERCTRACGFCLVDTRKPEALDPTEPDRVAEAVERMGLAFAVVTTVARDDLPDGGAGAMAATIEAIRRRTPGVQVEVLISDCRGDADALDTIFAARPDVLNHNIETVPRLQRAVRPVGRLRPLAGGAGPGPRRRAHHQVRPGRRHGRDRRRDPRHPRRPGRRRRRRSSPSASTCGPPPTTCRWPGG